ncbi:MAG: glycosyltransferase [Bryobacteraceae bacterium]
MIVSHVPHYRWQGRYWAYAPYAREIDLWADLFQEVVIAAPLREQAPPGEDCAFTRMNISVEAQREVGGESLAAKAGIALNLPLMVWDLAMTLRKGDAIHVRCPGNLGLLGALMAPFFTRRRIAKYAGQWGGAMEEAATVRWQRAILSSRWWGAPVTVYGKWPDQPAHVIPFFTSVLTASQVERGRAAAERRSVQPGRPLEALFLGRLSEAKNVDVLLRAIARLRSRGIEMRARILGDGPRAGSLRILAAELGVTDLVTFAGGVGYDEVLDALEQADILTLVSESEGWPKALAEGMAYGLVCIGSNRGFVPEMLSQGRGIVVEPRNVDSLADALGEIALHPERYADMRAKAIAWSRDYCLEALREALRELMIRHWGVPRDAFPALSEGSQGRTVFANTTEKPWPESA